MKLTIVAVGRLKAGPERTLTDRYLDRVVKAGRRVGLNVGQRELIESRATGATARMTQEATAILALRPPGAPLVALDETGRNLTSQQFAGLLAEWRDGGKTEVVLAIGGPDGHGQGVLEAASLRLAFGAMTWPHQFVRPMLSEQIYRAVTILAGHPYHRA